MQILHFCPAGAFSGLEQYAFDLTLRQKNLGLDVAMVVLKDSPLEKECIKHKIPYRAVNLGSRAAVFSVASQYREIIKEDPGLKVIHLHLARDIERLFFAFLMNAWPYPTKRPKIIQQNHIWISHSKKDPLHWLTHRLPDEIWCSSEPARQDLIRYLPVPEEKIKIVKYGRDLNLREQFLSRESARTQLNLPQDALVLGTIARIDPAKGIRELLDGSLPVLKSNPNLHLAIIGGPTGDAQSIEYSRKIEETVANLPNEIRSRIHLKGAIANAARLLKAFDLFSLPSYKETFSLALLDAQLAELPVLGTKSGGTPEVVIEGKTGWLCESEDSKSLQIALERALKDQSNWLSYASRARTRVEQEFEIGQVLNDIRSRYHLPS